MMRSGVLRAAMLGLALAGVLAMQGCATTTAQTPGVMSVQSEKAKFEQDRKAILAMAGDFDVTFDFRETVPLTTGCPSRDSRTLEIVPTKRLRSVSTTRPGPSMVSSMFPSSGCT